MSDNTGIGEATKIAKEYVQEYRPNDWDRVVDARQIGEKTEVEFQTKEDTNTTHKMVFDKEANITDVEFEG